MNVDQIFTFQLGTIIHHGYNSVAQTGAEAKRLGAKKVLIVSDKGVSEAGLIDPLAAALKSAKLPSVVFDDVEVDPGTATVHNGLKLLKDEKCNVIVVIGGGSPVCAAKGIALVATNGGSISDYEGMDKYKKPPLPVIAIPTTAGAGSEVSGVFIITDEARNYKMAIGGSVLGVPFDFLDSCSHEGEMSGQIVRRPVTEHRRLICVAQSVDVVACQEESSTAKVQRSRCQWSLGLVLDDRRLGLLELHLLEEVVDLGQRERWFGGARCRYDEDRSEHEKTKPPAQQGELHMRVATHPTRSGGNPPVTVTVRHSTNAS